MNALILVDLQNDFVPGGALAVPEGDAVVAVANRVQAQFDIVVATQDWHPPDHGSFAASHPGRQPGEFIQLLGQRQILWPTHCVQDTAGAEILSDLDTTRIAEVFRKGTDRNVDSYSGFFDNGRRRATGLGEFLNKHDVTRVYVMGLATDYCVKWTALDARSLRLDTVLIEDGCRGVELQAGDIEAAVAEMRAAEVRVVQSRDIGR